MGLSAIYASYDHCTPFARRTMALVSLYGGLALANTKLGAVHGFAGVLGGMYDAPHGALCAALLPHVTRVNLQALQQREPNSPALRRYGEIGQMIGRHDCAPWFGELVADLDIPPLRTYGVTRDDFPEIVEKSAKSSSMKGNPIALTHAELTEALEGAL